MSNLDKKIVVTGGGSGGHANTAISFVKALHKKYTNTLEQTLYIGGNLAMEGEINAKSIEHKLLENSEIQYKIIRAGKLQRYFNFQTIKLLLRTFGGFIDSFKTLKEFKPDLIFSTGGYVTVPVCIAARILKIPVYIHEQTINIGLANKISSKFAHKIFTTFPQSNKHFPKEKTIHTGNIVMEEILIQKKQDNSEIIQAIQKMLPEKEKYPIIYISGGSQGSHILNSTIKDMIHYLVQHYQVILQTGDNSLYKDYEKISQEKKKLPQKIQHRFFPIKYIESKQIGFVYKNMDLFVGRSGANTIYELGLIKKPSVLIPIPWVGKNEQYENAKILQNLGMAKIIPEGELICDILFDEINKLAKKENKFDNEKIDTIFVKDGIKKIFEEMNL